MSSVSDYCKGFLNSAIEDLNYTDLGLPRRELLRRTTELLVVASEKLLKAYYFCTWHRLIMLIYDACKKAIPRLESGTWKAPISVNLEKVKNFLNRIEPYVAIEPKELKHIVVAKWADFVVSFTETLSDGSFKESIKLFIAHLLGRINIGKLSSSVQNKLKVLLMLIDDVLDYYLQSPIHSKIKKPLEDLKTKAIQKDRGPGVCDIKYFEEANVVINELKAFFDKKLPQALKALANTVMTWDGVENSLLGSETRIEVDFNDIIELMKEQTFWEELILVTKLYLPFHLLYPHLIVYNCIKASYPDTIFMEPPENWRNVLENFKNFLREEAEILKECLDQEACILPPELVVDTKWPNIQHYYFCD